MDSSLSNERILLNVGGIKYETTRSTLTAYPNSMLGTMFDARNQAMLHPRNGNEYFFDRNGYAFYYIMEFYRTGKVTWRGQSPLAFPDNSELPIGLSHPVFVSQEELEHEIEYFQIPVKESRLELAEKAAASLVDDFVHVLGTVILEATSQLIDTLEITFYQDGTPVHATFGKDRLQKFAQSGFHILRIHSIDGKMQQRVFYTKLTKIFKARFPGSSWSICDSMSEQNRPQSSQQHWQRLRASKFINFERVARHMQSDFTK